MDALELGIARAERSDLAGGDAHVNAAAVRDTLAGKRGPVRDATVVNAAAAIAAYRGFDGHEPPTDDELKASLRRAIGDAAAAIDSGAAGRVLEAWVGGA